MAGGVLIDKTANALVIVVEGADYDALGQWTDETIKGVILTKLGLLEA